MDKESFDLIKESYKEMKKSLLRLKNAVAHAKVQSLQSPYPFIGQCSLLVMDGTVNEIKDKLFEFQGELQALEKSMNIKER